MLKILNLLLLLPLSLLAQDKHDYNWMLGTPPNNPANLYGGSWIKFHSEPPEVSFFNTPLRLASHATVSDKDGQLLFYTNGCKIANWQHQIMSNGDSLNPGKTYNDYCKNNGSYPVVQGHLILPWPESEHRHILFHMRIADGFDLLKTEMLSSVVDMSLENGLGGVIPKYKNQIAVDDTLAPMLTAVRHGNGRDWWVVVPRNASNGYYRLLLTPAGLSGPYIQHLGTPWTYQYWSGQAAFSPDGSWYARANPHNELHLFRFDRCTGLLSQPLKLPLPGAFACGVAFSPNSQRLYVGTGFDLFQYDLTKTNVAGSKKLVGQYDGYTMGGLATNFFQMMPAPNGKIYMTSTTGVTVMHTIHNPNALGLACDFQQHDLLLPTRRHWMPPNFPHFRLYDLPGSPCDTLGISAAPAPTLPAGSPVALWPNPAEESCTVQYLGAGHLAGQWALHSSTGQVARQGVWPEGRASMTLEVGDLAPGAYFWVLRTEAGETVVREMVVLR